MQIEPIESTNVTPVNPENPETPETPEIPPIPITSATSDTSASMASANNAALQNSNYLYRITNKILYMLSTIPPAGALAAAAGMLSGSNANKQFNTGYMQGLEAGMNYNGSNFHQLRAKGSAAIACAPEIPPIMSSFTAFFTLEAVWFLAWKAGHTGNPRFLLSALGVLVGGTTLITLENIATMTGCTELDGFLLGLQKGHDYTCTQTNSSSVDCQGAEKVINPTMGIRSFANVSSVTTNVFAPIVAGVGVLGSFFSYASGRVRKNEEEAAERQPLLIQKP